MEYEAVIGLEVHAELMTRSKMFCACPVVDSTLAKPNTAVCPVCMGMPGVLPVINRQAVEYALRVALALECAVANTSIFARKNYFYPDLPKGYQISQYEYPLAQNGVLCIQTSRGERAIRIRRAHLEEDTGKLTHVAGVGGQKMGYSLVDLNRAGVPLLEIVSEPDMHTVEEARIYSEGLRSILCCLGVSSGDMEKGAIRFEANVSVRPLGSQELGTRVEIKNLNSFRAMERATAYQIEQQIARLEAGQKINQETLGWDETRGVTYSQRSKEEAHDYRYFPEPDLPPLVVEKSWIERVAAELPELPYAKMMRFQHEYALSAAQARMLSEEQAIANYFEAVVASAPNVAAQTVANWLTGEIFSWLNQAGRTFDDVHVRPGELAELLCLAGQAINLNTAKAVLVEMLDTGKTAPQIIRERDLQQVSDAPFIAEIVQKILHDNPRELSSYLGGKETLSNWFFGQACAQRAGRPTHRCFEPSWNASLTY
jgi:aspartyl-tRNA(Asn)/glutamyl-tRNA(Gln) amidotransferase subunit B